MRTFSVQLTQMLPTVNLITFPAPIKSRNRGNHNGIIILFGSRSLNAASKKKTVHSQIRPQKNHPFLSDSLQREQQENSPKKSGFPTRTDYTCTLCGCLQVNPGDEPAIFCLLSIKSTNNWENISYLDGDFAFKCYAWSRYSIHWDWMGKWFGHL